MAREETKIVLGAVDNVTPTLNRIGKELGSLNKAFGALAGGALVGLTAIVSRTVTSLDQLGDKAKQLNITTEALSGLGFVAEKAGSSAQTLERGLTRLNKTVGDAANGNKQASDLFERLGVSITDSAGKTRKLEDILVDVSERFRNFKDGPQEAALAAELFGKSIGPELLEFLNLGKGGIEQFREQARGLGAEISGDTVKGAQDLKDNLKDLQTVGTGLAVEITRVLIPALTGVAEALLSIRKASEGFVGSLDAGFGGAATDVIEKLSLEISRAEAELQALREQFALDPTEDLRRAIEAQQNLIRNTERTLERLRKAQKDVGDTAKKAADEAGKLEAPIVRTGQACGKAAPEVRKLAQEVERLNGFNAAFQASLRPVSESMQQLVEDIDLGAVSFGNLGESLETLNATATEEAQFFADNWAGAVDAASDAFADFIAGNIESFEDFGDALESIARQFLANLVRQFLQTNLQLPAPSFGGGGGAGGGFGGFSFGGPGASLGARFGLGAAGAGIAYQGYQSGNPLQGAAGGALLGFQIAGPVGAVVGALLGGVAAALNDTTRRLTVIGDDLVGTRGFQNFAPGSTFDSRLGGFTIASIDNVSADERRQLGQAVADFDNEIAALLNADQLTAVTDALANFNLRLEEGAITAENILGQRFEAILGTFDQATQDFVRGAGDLEDQVAALADILSRPARLDALLRSLEDANEGAGLSAFERALRDINAQFDQAADAAEQLGATQEQLARIEALRGAAIERLNDAQRASLDALLDDLRFDDATSGLSGAERAAAAINRQFDALREQALALGATQADLELIERRRTAALREQASATADATDALDDFYDMIGDSRRIAQEFEADFLGSLSDAIQGVRDFLNRGFSVSSQTPLEQLGRAQAQFETLVRGASTGDLESIRALGGAGDALLRQAAGFYGVGSAEFQGLEAAVRGTLTRVANTPLNSRDAALMSLIPLFQQMIDLLRSNGQLTAQQTQQVTGLLARLGQQPARAF